MLIIHPIPGGFIRRFRIVLAGVFPVDSSPFALRSAGVGDNHGPDYRLIEVCGAGSLGGGCGFRNRCDLQGDVEWGRSLRSDESASDTYLLTGTMSGFRSNTQENLIVRLGEQAIAFCSSL
jgi:hypothetical protein